MQYKPFAGPLRQPHAVLQGTFLYGRGDVQTARHKHRVSPLVKDMLHACSTGGTVEHQSSVRSHELAVFSQARALHPSYDSKQVLNPMSVTLVQNLCLMQLATAPATRVAVVVHLVSQAASGHENGRRNHRHGKTHCMAWHASACTSLQAFQHWDDLDTAKVC